MPLSSERVGKKPFTITAKLKSSVELGLRCRTTICSAVFPCESSASKLAPAWVQRHTSVVQLLTSVMQNSFALLDNVLIVFKNAIKVRDTSEKEFNTNEERSNNDEYSCRYIIATSIATVDSMNKLFVILQWDSPFSVSSSIIGASLSRTAT